VASKHVLAFARREGNSFAVVAVPRLFAQLLGNRSSISDPEIWQDTRIKLPSEFNDATYLNWMTGEKCIPTRDSSGQCFIEMALAIKTFPWLLLINEAKFASQV
jgi:maltooligosyltrehalose synthase